MRANRQLLRLAFLSFQFSSFRSIGGQTIAIRDAGRCDSCRITAKRLATLGRSTDPELLNDFPSVQVDSRGRFLVSGTTSRSFVLVYDRQGAFLRLWGRQGSGPGEFRSIWRLLHLPGDSLVVIEQGNRRITVLDSAGKYVRSFALNFQPIEIDPLANDSWMASGMAFTEDHVGYPLHQLTRDGITRRSFGGDMEVLVGRPSSTQRMIATDTLRDGVWSARPDRYEIEFWTANGERRLTLDRLTAWFPDRDIEGSRNRWQDPIHPRLRDMYVDDSGHVWVLLAVAKEGWKPSPENFGPLSTHWLNLDTMVEVIDPDSGELVASQRFPWIASAFTNNGSLVSYREDADGIMVLDIWRPELVRRKGGKQ